MPYTAIYDLAVSPVSYDFLTFLTRARMLAGGQPLHVAIEPRQDGGFIDGTCSREWGGHDEAETRWRLWNIVVPACQLAGVTVELRHRRLAGEGVRINHLQRDLLADYRTSGPFPILRASDQARKIVDGWFRNMRYRRLFTITLRNSLRDPQRNSNKRAWADFYRWCENFYGADWEALHLWDTSETLARGPCGTFAELSLDLRLALYERADMNFFVQNGPAALCWYSQAPFIQFGCGGHVTTPADPAWSKHWRDMGLVDGAQLPWATPSQRLVYAPDDFETLVRETVGWDITHRMKAA